MRFRKYLIWVLIFGFSFIYSTYSVVKHMRMESYIFDLGYYDQLLWLTSNFRIPFSSIIEAHTWTDHFSPSFLLLTPLYWIWNDVRILLIFQAVFVCLGAYPIYKLSQKYVKDYWFSITVSFCYLIFYGVQNALAFDFHPVSLGASVLAFVFWKYEQNKWLSFWILVVFFAGLQENFLILTAALGVFIAIKYKDYKKGIFIGVTFFMMFLLLIFVLLPKYFGESYHYLPTHIGNTNMLKMLYFPYSKLEVVFFSLLSFAFLPTLSPSFWILLGEEFLGRFLATTNANWWILGFHYNAILTPILAFATINVTKKYFKNKEKVIILLLLVGTIISLIKAKPDTIKIFNRDFYDFSETKDEKEVLNMIPKEVSVAATNNLGAQIAHREGLVFLTNCVENETIWGEDTKRCFKLKPDYIVADMDSDENNNYYPDYDRDSIFRYFEYIESEGEYELIVRIDNVFLYKRIVR